MDSRVVFASLAALLAASASAQQAPVSPIPATPVPAETQANPALVTPQDQRQQRLQTPGAPQDTGVKAERTGRPQQQAQAPQGSQADAQHIRQMLAMGTVTLQASTLARTKAQNEQVKRFAAFEEAEQNTLSDVIHSLAEPATTASTSQETVQATAQNAPRSPAEAAATAPVIPDQDAAMLDRLSQAQPGRDFDRDYVRLQMERHQDLLASQDRYLGSNPPNRELTSIAKLARVQIREHLTLLQDLQKQLGP
jgi:predicted outer membrane protein